MINRLFLTLFLLLLPLWAEAVGFRDIVSESFLGQPLKARIELVSTEEYEPEDVRVSLATRDEFERAGIYRLSLLNGLTFEVVGEGADQFVILVGSRDMMREPILTFLIAVEWPGNRVLREYTLLLDPPSYPAVTSPVAAASSAPEEPVAAVQPATKPAPLAVYGPVAPAETLWGIAKKLRPSNEISVEQMMLAIQRVNPDAFKRGNVNLLQAGAVLKIPDRNSIERLSKRQARQAFLDQTKAWRAFRSGAGALPTQLVGVPSAPGAPAVDSAPVSSLRPVPPSPLPAAPKQPIPAEESGAQHQPEPAAPEVSLRVVETESTWRSDLTADAGAQGGEPVPLKEEERLAGAIADSAQDLMAVREINRNLAELRSVLEARIDALRASLEEKDRVIDKLQRQLEEMAAKRKQQAAVQQKEITRRLDTAPERPDPSTQAPAREQPGLQPERIEIEQATPMVPGLDRVLQYWIPLLLAVVTLLLLLLMLLVRRRRAEAKVPGPEAFSSYTELDADPRTEQLPAGAMTENIVKSYDDDDGLFLETGADVSSALTEADIYLAYRRYNQAESLIKEAIDANKGSMVLRAKLLEIYAFRKDKKRFVAFMEEVHDDMVEQAPEIWAKVVEMGRELAPEHPFIVGTLLPDEIPGNGDDSTDAFSLPTEADRGNFEGWSEQPLELDLEQDDEPDKR